MLHRIIANCPKLERLFDRTLNIGHIKLFQEPQNLHVFAFAFLSHPRLQQSVQSGKHIRQVPALQRGRLIKCANLLFQKR